MFKVRFGDGYIFTFVWAFSEDRQQEYIHDIAEKFRVKGFDVFWIELEPDLRERIKRNRTPNRLSHKPSKRDVSWSETHLLESEEKYRLNSLEGEIAQENYLRIQTTNLSALEVAKEIWRFIEPINNLR